MANCICVLCVGDDGCDCLQVHTPPGVIRLSCNYCKPAAGVPVSEEAWARFIEELGDAAEDLAEQPDDSWRKWNCYTCKDTGECPHCEDDWED
jgi:hypothetical protein